MVESKTLAYTMREKLKKANTKRLRKDGAIPAVIYGHGEPRHISVDKRDFNKKFKVFTRNTTVLLKGDKTHEVLIKDIDDNLLHNEVRHIDFYEIEKGKSFKTMIPVKLTGTSVGVKEGGILNFVHHEIEVETLLPDLVEVISVDISTLKIGDSVHVKDLKVGSKMKVLTNGEVTIVVVNAPKVEVVEEVAPVAATKKAKKK